MNNVHLLVLVFISQLFANAQAAEPLPVRLETSQLSPGLLIKFQVNNLPVFVLNRRPNEIASLRQSYGGSKERVASCATCDPVLRSISPNYLVVWGYNPSSGCELIYASSTATDWVGHPVHGRGGFVDKCSATEYDLTGRKLLGPNASPNELAVPPHSFHKGVIEIEANPKL
jgi:hypothetical protein